MICNRSNNNPIGNTIIPLRPLIDSVLNFIDTYLPQFPKALKQNEIASESEMEKLLNQYLIDFFNGHSHNFSPYLQCKFLFRKDDENKGTNYKPDIGVIKIKFAQQLRAKNYTATKNDNEHAERCTGGDFFLVPQTRDDRADHRVEQGGNGGKNRANKTHRHVGAKNGHRTAAQRGQRIPFGDFAKAHQCADIITRLAQHQVPDKQEKQHGYCMYPGHHRGGG